MISVDEDQSEAIGVIVKEFHLREGIYDWVLNSKMTEEQNLKFLFHVVAICHDTRSLQGVIEGEKLVGWDYLWKAFRREQNRNPEVFSNNNLQNITLEDLKSILSDDGDPTKSTISNPERRIELLKSGAEGLLSNFEGSVSTLLHRCGGYLQTRDKPGLIQLLSGFDAYSDPLQKKTWVLCNLVREIAPWWVILDPENLSMPIDYHMQRVALRAGMILVPKDIHEKLQKRAPADEDLDSKIRRAAQSAYLIVSRISGYSVLDLDRIFWSLGRSCCSYLLPEPTCAIPTKRTTGCTFSKTVKHKCEGNCCPLAGACRGAKDPKFRNLYETNVSTDYY